MGARQAACDIMRGLLALLPVVGWAFDVKLSHLMVTRPLRIARRKCSAWAFTTYRRSSGERSSKICSASLRSEANLRAR